MFNIDKFMESMQKMQVMMENMEKMSAMMEAFGSMFDGEKTSAAAEIMQEEKHISSNIHKTREELLAELPTEKKNTKASVKKEPTGELTSDRLVQYSVKKDDGTWMTFYPQTWYYVTGNVGFEARLYMNMLVETHWSGKTRKCHPIGDKSTSIWAWSIPTEQRKNFIQNFQIVTTLTEEQKKELSDYTKKKNSRKNK